MGIIEHEGHAFLGVETSLSGRRWQERLDARSRNIALDIAQRTGMPELIARVIAARGVTAEAAVDFLEPTLRDLMPDPSTLTDMDAACSRLAEAIAGKERIAIFGDYDVDGAAASALLSRFLAAHDVPHEIYIPDRIFEGYGPNPEAIRQLAERGARLIVTVDCGATSFEALASARALGLAVIVLDHHQMGAERPEAAALVNPNRQDDLSGLTYLAAAGVVFMALVAVQRELRRRGLPPGPALLDLLDLVALATVCDMVPLTGLNRAFVVQGLKIMRAQKNAGLAALSRVARLDGPIAPYHLGFLLGPRINAGGRIGDAALGSRLLAGDDPQTAGEIAEELERLNRERQAAEAAMLEEALAEGEAEMAGSAPPSVLVTAREGWHPGIVGLLATRLKDRFHRPTIAIAFDGNGGGTGSGRSIAGADLGKAVREAVAAGILEKGGGHQMAAGLSVRRERLGDLRAFLENALGEAVGQSSAHRVLKLDGALSARGATLDFCDLVERAGPYGTGHSQAVFALANHNLRDARAVGRDHVSLTLVGGDGTRLRAISFRSADTPLGRALLEGVGRRFHFAGSFSADHWQGRRRVQLRLIDAAPAN